MAARKRVFPGEGGGVAAAKGGNSSTIKIQRERKFCKDTDEPWVLVRYAAEHGDRFFRK